MNIQDYLRELSKKYKPNSILDIGAHHGEFSKFCKSLWKDVDLLMIEGNDECDSILDNVPFDHCIVLLSDTNKEVTLYLNPNNLDCTGTSYYKERTRHYKNSIEVKKNTYTLDEVVEDIDKKYDIIKKVSTRYELPDGNYSLDTEEEYDEIIEYMNNIGFSDYEIIEEHKWIDKNENTFEYGSTFQVDVVFKK